MLSPTNCWLTIVFNNVLGHKLLQRLIKFGFLWRDSSWSPVIEICSDKSPFFPQQTLWPIDLSIFLVNLLFLFQFPVATTSLCSWECWYFSTLCWKWSQLLWEEIRSCLFYDLLSLSEKKKISEPGLWVQGGYKDALLSQGHPILGAKCSAGKGRPQIFLTCLSWHGMRERE